MATPNIVTSSTIIQRSLFTPTMRAHGEMMLGQDAHMPGLHVDREWHRGQEVSPRARHHCQTCGPDQASAPWEEGLGKRGKTPLFLAFWFFGFSSSSPCRQLLGGYLMEVITQALSFLLIGTNLTASLCSPQTLTHRCKTTALTSKTPAPRAATRPC